MFLDIDTQGLSEKTLREIIETLEDCNCQTCGQFLIGFKTTLFFSEEKNIQMAALTLTNTCTNIGMLLVPQDFASN